jgi:hypothetical protein
MRGVGGFVAAIVMAAAQCGWVDLAVAEDGRDGPSFLFFTGMDLWRNGGFLHDGLMWSPEGLDRDGFIFKAVISGGSYRYRSGALGNAQVIGRELGAVIMPGWRFKRDALEIKVFAGLDIRNYRLWPDDPSSRLRGRPSGVSGAVDLWYQPTPLTVLAADASISSIGKNASGRAAFGWRFLDLLYLGPEAQAFVCSDYRQYRLGLHVTAFKPDPLDWKERVIEWSAAIGWAGDSDHRSGVYGRLGMLTRR